MEGALEELASKANGVLELKDINAVLDRFSVDMEEKKLSFSLGGDIWKAINRHGFLRIFALCTRNILTRNHYLKETLIH